MDKMLSNPWILRVIALALAILLFVSVKSELDLSDQNTSGRDVEVLREVPLEVYYDDDNSVVTGTPETVTVNIEGPTQQVKSTKVMKDYKVFVDLRDLTYGEHRVAISTEYFSDKLKVKVEPAFIDVVIDERISEEFTVDLDMNESLLAENYVLANTTVEPKVVTITGAKSVIDSIGYVKASITGSKGINKSFEQQASVRVLDMDLNKLDVIVEPRTVLVKVGVEEYSKEVPIILGRQGTPKDGVTIRSLTTEAEKIRVFGPKSILDKIKQLNVDVDVNKIEESGTFNLKLLLPDGVTKLSTDKIKIKAEVTVNEPTEPVDEEEDVSSNITEKSFQNVQIVVRGLAENLQSSFQFPDNGVVTVIAKGPQEALNKVQANNISIYVDAENSELGETVLPIHIDGPSNIEWETSEPEATLTITEA